MKRWILMWPVLLLLLLPTGVLQAHSRLGTTFKKKYRLRSVTCTACHLKGEEKDQEKLNEFGTTLAKLVEGKEITQRFEAIKDASAEEQKAVYDEIDKEFLEALKKLDTMKAPSGKTYDEAIRAGEIEGTRLRK